MIYDKAYFAKLAEESRTNRYLICHYPDGTGCTLTAATTEEAKKKLNDLIDICKEMGSDAWKTLRIVDRNDLRTGFLRFTPYPSSAYKTPSSHSFQSHLSERRR